MHRNRPPPSSADLVLGVSVSGRGTAVYVDPGRGAARKTLGSLIKNVRTENVFGGSISRMMADVGPRIRAPGPRDGGRAYPSAGIHRWNYWGNESDR